MIIDGKDVNIEDVIKFRTRNNHEPYYVQGIVAGVCNYMTARIYTDIDKYHSEVRTSNPTDLTIPDNCETATFVLVKDAQGVTNAYALLWIEPTTLEIIDPLNEILVKIFAPSSETGTILKLLRDNRYDCLIQV
jgi:hypothetical protein